MIEARIVEQAPERLKAHGSLPDMLVAIELRSARRLGVVTVPHAHGLEGHGRGNLLHSIGVALGAHQVVAGDPGVAGVKTNRNRRVMLQPRYQFRYLLKAAAE